MKHLIIATTIALGLACGVGTSVAQDASQTRNLAHVTVTAPPARYETYTVDLNAGYGFEALVGNTHWQYMQAKRAAERAERLRKQGNALSPSVTVAIDNSSDPGVLGRFILLDATQHTVAIVDAYCKWSAPAGGRHCQLISRPVSNGGYDQSLASIAPGRVHLVEVARH